MCVRKSIDVAKAGLRSYGERLRELESRTASLSFRESPAELLRADRDHC